MTTCASPKSAREKLIHLTLNHIKLIKVFHIFCSNIDCIHCYCVTCSRQSSVAVRRGLYGVDYCKGCCVGGSVAASVSAPRRCGRECGCACVRHSAVYPRVVIHTTTTTTPHYKVRYFIANLYYCLRLV